MPMTVSSAGPNTARSFTTERFFSMLLRLAFSKALKSSSS